MEKLFPIDLPTAQWSEFKASGYKNPVSGVIYRSEVQPTNGMPLGGIDTGLIDIEANGTFGYMTIFNSHVPRRGPLNLPFLGVHSDNRTWVLTTQPLNPVERVPNIYMHATDVYHVNGAKEIHYWGHYPILDMEFVTDAQVEIGMRTWVPFIPGDLAVSNSPCAVFEVHLRNLQDKDETGVLVFSFPGPSEAEAGGFPLRRRFIRQNNGFTGMEVVGEKAGYVLGVIDQEKVKTGGDLGLDSGAWERCGKGLPTATNGPGCSISVEFHLPAHTEKTVCFILSWYSPVWYAGGTPDPMSKFTLRWYEHELKEGGPNDGRGSAYTHMYAARFGNAVEVAQFVAREHIRLLERILSWQAAIYDDHNLPGWLSDSLVNIFHLISETGLWAMSKPPLGSWCRPEDGLFGMIEDPRHCPQIECLPCSFYGNYPLALFFPQLAVSTLRGEKAYQFENGELTWIFGGMTVQPPSGPCEMATPHRGYQTTLNGACVVDMVYRYWKCNQDEDALRELYDMVKRCTIFTMNLRPEDGADGIISFPSGNKGMEWFEACSWAGMAAHAGGIHLAQLRQAEVIARHIGDIPFAEQCREWLRQGSHSMEEKMWAGSYYLNYWEPATGKKSELVMANQLDGEWQMRMAGLEGVFDPGRVKVALQTIKRTCIDPIPYGAVNFADINGRPTSDGEGSPGWSYDPYAYFPPEVLMLGMLYIYEGEVEFGLELCRRCWGNIIRQGLTWDQPNIIKGDTGERVYGGDYYQNMMLWVVPAAVLGQDLGAFCQPGGLVERIIQAGSEN